MPRINAVSFREYPGIEAVCRTVRQAGFDSLELSRPLFYDKLVTGRLRGRFAEWAARQGLSLFGFDCWVDVQPYERPGETLADFRRAIDWAADLNLGLLITHDPWARVNGRRTPAECLQTCVSLFRRVVGLCAEKQLRLVFEPHPDTLSMDNAWCVDFVDAVAEEAPPGSVGVLYDCCHYGVGQPDGYLQSIRALARRIQHVHFADGDRQTYALHLPLGDGDLDLSAVVATLKEIGYHGSLTNDLFNYPLLEDGARRNAESIRRLEDSLGLLDASS